MDKVDTQSPHTFKSTDQRVTRRGFLGLSVKGVAALTVGGLGLGGIEEFIRNNPTIIDHALITLAVDSGEFTANRIGPIKNLSDIANKKTKELSINGSMLDVSTIKKDPKHGKLLSALSRKKSKV